MIGRHRPNLPRWFFLYICNTTYTKHKYANYVHNPHTVNVINHFHCCIATAQSGYVINRAIKAQQITKRTQRDKVKMLITATRHRKLEDEDRSQTAL